jgi:hypothetical protein
MWGQWRSGSLKSCVLYRLQCKSMTTPTSVHTQILRILKLHCMMSDKRKSTFKNV